MINRYILAFLVMGWANKESFAQAPDSLSLPQVWEQAFSRYPSLESRQAAINEANINQKLVRNEYLPQVQLQAQNTIGTRNGSTGAFFPLTGIFNVSGSTLNDPEVLSANLSASAVLNWEFFQFGRHRKSMELAENEVAQASSAMDVEQLNIQGAVTRDYIQLLFHEQMLGWAGKNANRLDDLFTISKSLATAGLSPGADSLLVKASYKQAQAEYKDWKGKAAGSGIALAKWLGKPTGRVVVKPYAFFSKERLAENPHRLLPADHPVLALREQQIEYAGKMRELSARNSFPTISFLAGALMRSNSLLEGEAPQNILKDAYQAPMGNYLIGLGLTWDINALYDQRLQNMKFKERIHARQAEYNTVKINLSSQQQIALRELEYKNQQIEDANIGYASAEQAYELFEARYTSGLINLAELLQIQVLLQQAEKTRIEAYWQFWRYATDLAESQSDFSFLGNVFK